jgi:YgiT-type zinc finger domain-containing protein
MSEPTETKQCYQCGGTMVEQRVRFPRDLDGQLVLFENVPAWVCRQCGARAFRATVVDELDRIQDERPTPPRIEPVPVYDLTDVPLGLAATKDRGLRT